jgi:hypothetical protein
MLDPGMGTAIATAIWRARVDGLNTAELLDRKGLILTSARRKQIQTDLLDELLTQLEDQHPHQLAALSGQQTVADAVNGTIEFIRFFRKAVAG